MTISTLDPTVPTDLEPAGQGAAEIRATKLAVHTAFPAVDAEIQNELGSPPTAAEFTALFNRLKSVEDGVGSGLVGEIKVYYGTAENIPTGWYLCDGTNGTPNMIGRMLIQSDAAAGAQAGLPTYDGNSSGGNLPSELQTGEAGDVTASVSIADHVLVQNNIPSHQHLVAKDSGGVFGGVTPDASPNQAIEQWGAGGDDNQYRLGQSGGDNADVGLSSKWGAAGAVDPLVHTGSEVTIPAHSHTLSGASLPPWHAVYYIMFTGA